MSRRTRLNAPTYAMDAANRYPSKARSAARNGTIRPLPALPPIIGTAPTRSLNPAVGSFTSYTLAQSLPKVTAKGGLLSQLTANSLTTLTNTVNPVTSSAFPTPYFLDFMVDDTFDIKFRDNAGSSLACIWLWQDNLDGLGWQRVTQYTESTGASALGGGAQVWRVTFASSALRKMRVFFKNCEFAGLRAAPVTTIQPVPRTEPTVALLGDSWMDSASGNLGQHSAYYNAALLLGMEPWLCGQGGTGYCTRTTNANLGSYTDTRRTAPIITAAPDYLIIEGSINDDLNYNPGSTGTVTSGNSSIAFAAAHGWAVGDQVTFTASTATPFTSSTVYFVVAVADTTHAAFSATSGGSAISPTGSGTITTSPSAPTAYITAQAAALYATFATALPNTKLIVFGIQSLGSPTGGLGDTNSVRLANNTAVKAAAIAAPNVAAFIDCIAEGWIAGTGNTGATTTIGNSDKLMNSTYHLAQYGHEVIAQRIARSIAETLNAA